MFKPLSILILPLAVALPSIAQQSGQRPGGSTGGHIVWQLEAWSNPQSLLDLVRQSQLIVDGTVQTILPPINMSASHDGPVIETHAIVAINSVLQGVVPNASANLLIAQEGGQLGKWNVEVADDPLVQSGERYILFLVPDDRKELPNTTGVPRYAVIGVSVGKVKVTGDDVFFAKPSSATLHAYDGATAETFLESVRKIVAHPYTDSQLPNPFPRK